MEKFTSEIAAKLNAAFEKEEVKALVDQTEKAATAETGTFEVVITTENIDRYNEIIKMDGWDLDHYRANPVVLWGHDHSRIIGICTELTIEDGQMIAKGKFAPTTEGQELRQLYEEGFLKATSVGFIEKEREGNVITKAELIEFSFVSVPANPYALALALENERSIDELVTKGILNVKTTDPVEPEGDNSEGEQGAEPAEPETPAEKEPTEEQKALARMIADLVIKDLADTSSALEDVEEDAPEGTEGDEEADEDVKAFEEKRSLQELATILGEELAERRRQREAARQ